MHQKCESHGVVEAGTLVNEQLSTVLAVKIGIMSQSIFVTALNTSFSHLLTKTRAKVERKVPSTERLKPFNLLHYAKAMNYRGECLFPLSTQSPMLQWDLHSCYILVFPPSRSHSMVERTSKSF